jgi:hypothetical protein
VSEAYRSWGARSAETHLLRGGPAYRAIQSDTLRGGARPSGVIAALSSAPPRVLNEAVEARLEPSAPLAPYVLQVGLRQPQLQEPVQGRTFSLLTIRGHVHLAWLRTLHGSALTLGPRRAAHLDCARRDLLVTAS